VTSPEHPWSYFAKRKARFWEGSGCRWMRARVASAQEETSWWDESGSTLPRGLSVASTIDNVHMCVPAKKRTQARTPASRTLAVMGTHQC